MTEMVERATDAVWEQVFGLADGNTSRDEVRNIVLDVLSALREPTEEMATAGAIVIWKFNPDYAETRPSVMTNPDAAESIAADAWRVMIDAALKGKAA
jgi:hypothetical protein